MTKSIETLDRLTRLGLIQRNARGELMRGKFREAVAEIERDTTVEPIDRAMTAYTFGDQSCIIIERDTMKRPQRVTAYDNFGQEIASI